MNFLLGAAIFFLMGVYTAFRPSKGALLFVLFFFIYPTGNIFVDLNTFGGLFVADFYFAGLILRILPSLRDYLLYFPRLILELLAVVCIFSVYVAAAYADPSTEFMNKYQAKDLRPFILVFELWLFFPVVQKIKITFVDFRKIAIVGAVSNIISILLVWIGVFSVQDAFYQENSYRYLSAASYMSGLYIVLCLYIADGRMSKSFGYMSNWINNLVLLLSLANVLLANSRFLIVALLTAVIVIGFNKIKKFLSYMVMAFVVLFVFVGVSFVLKVERVTSALDSGGLNKQVNNRFSPGFWQIEDMEAYQYIIGKGLGVTFEIPWFSYRDLDVFSNTLDSSYLTFFVKYGVFGIMFLMWTIRFCVEGLSRRIKYACFLYVMAIYFVSAIHYQGYGLGLFVYIVLVGGFVSRMKKLAVSENEKYINY